ncbi:FAD/NAD(P)-binding domain-containing protein [Laetiporus sulphureus 93-53]|uniref:Kynurenine 3-monooxygenase n=1 Tax=Laetiporus sulphureus 93-53 TaxID=1314785 RepID=A0A165H4A1_9APHY|nr:FAD/NAD(P)-binding domain-containing protein [Laetiporus sulphureus 93-53]KZT11222.1 FAD/NAD(P)-binding domain-containing protein [Laetiporus sulphureus 93-53]
MSANGVSPRKAVVVGAGPVGCLAAISLAKMGWMVEVYEGRPDMRLPSSKAAAQQRSINLAISTRGIAAIEAIEPKAADRFLKAVIPMRGRMIHHVGGRQESQPYDKDGQCINSIGRAFMNEDLLTDALTMPNTRAFFRHKVLNIDFDARVMSVRDEDAGQDKSVPFDFCVGADGCYSIVRSQLMRVVRMDYQQEYLPHDYLELKMPAGPPAQPGGEPTYLLDPNHLHIWPRHTFMLIALPNKDKTFTCTLFAPTTDFDRLDAPERIVNMFKTYFPDALPLIGEQALLYDFAHNPRSSLMTVKAEPYHYKDRAIILGDAAHAMVPFYGQGLNCGLEDVRVLDILLRAEGVDAATRVPDGEDDCLAKALARYSESRHEDLVSICELAMDNYVEMRHDVVTLGYLLCKAFDNILYSLTSKAILFSSLLPALTREPFPTRSPSGWLPQYTMVSFRPDISYSTVRRKAVRQRQILERAGWASVAVGVGAAGVAAFSVWRRLCNRA